MSDQTKWDTYWLNMCNIVAENSSCLSKKLGAIVVKDGKYLISTGYNGPPAGCRDCSDEKYREQLFYYVVRDGRYSRDFLNTLENDLRVCPRRVLLFKSGEGLEYCQAAHAERNSLITAAKLGHSVEGMTMYMNCGIPCLECSKEIINAGIKEIVVTKMDTYDVKGIDGKYLLREANVKIRINNLMINE